MAHLYAYQNYSKSARDLATGLGIKRIKHDGSKFNPNGKKIINWGSTDRNIHNYSEEPTVTIINHPLFVARSRDKSVFLSDLAVRGISIPDNFRIRQDAASYMKKSGCAMMARTVLTGHSGQGIIYCEDPNELPEAPLYTQYIKKAAEYRLHFIRKGDDIVHFIQRKARVLEHPKENVNWKIQNLAGGFIYANDPVNVGKVPDCVMEQALAAFLTSGLSFGAVDVIYNKKKGMAYVLELNTAPGLTGSTLNFYINNLKDII